MLEKVIIMGAAGRDFHNFNVYFKDNPRYKVIAITATQIPDIAGRMYPSSLAGELYPQGIPIYHENELCRLIRQHAVDLVAFSYSDVRHTDIMHIASSVMAAGADFTLIGATYTMLRSRKPVVAICAVRTGCGKSQTTRYVCTVLQGMGQKVVGRLAIAGDPGVGLDLEIDGVAAHVHSKVVLDGSDFHENPP